MLGDPLLALARLATDLRARCIGLHAGDFVTNGTCTLPLALLPGDAVQCDFCVLGRWRAGSRRSQPGDFASPTNLTALPFQADTA